MSGKDSVRVTSAELADAIVALFEEALRTCINAPESMAEYRSHAQLLRERADYAIERAAVLSVLAQRPTTAA